MKENKSAYILLWEKVVSPSSTLPTDQQRNEARLLASFIIITVILVIIANIATSFADFTRISTSAPIVVPAIIIAMIGYVFSRTQHYQVGVVCIIIAFSGAATLSPYANPDYAVIGPISVSFSLLIAAIFFDLRDVIIVGVISWLALIVTLYLLPREIISTESSAIILWVAVMTLMVIIWLRYRQNIERERQLQRAEMEIIQQKTDFIQQVMHALSHDLKTPLTIMHTSLYLLESLTDPARQQDKIETIKRQTIRLESLIQDILMMSQLDNAPTSNVMKLNPNTILYSIEQDLRPLIDAKQLDFQMHVEADLPSILANQEEIIRAFSNLIENAIHYTPNEGTIQVETHKHNQQIEVFIQDTGIGISEDEQKLVFERFYRSDEARSTVTGGTGLGLAIVQSIIKRHNGQISLESKLGEGTRLRVLLPIMSY